MLAEPEPQPWAEKGPCTAHRPSTCPMLTFSAAVVTNALVQADLEAYFHRYLGISKVIWLGDGVVGDVDTSGVCSSNCCAVSLLLLVPTVS